MAELRGRAGPTATGLPRLSAGASAAAALAPAPARFLVQYLVLRLHLQVVVGADPRCWADRLGASIGRWSTRARP